jgi:hypothetical protein
MKVKIPSLVLATIGVAFGVASSAAAVPVNNNNSSQTINSRGSAITFGLDQKLSNIYGGSEGCWKNVTNPDFRQWITCAPTQPPGIIGTENYDHDGLVQWDAQSWSWARGIRVLCNQNGVFTDGRRVADVVPTEIVRTGNNGLSDSSDDPPTCPGLVLKAYAKDAIVPVNWRGQPGSPAVNVNNLTIAQLQGIFVNCTITNWNQLGSPISAPIVVWGVFTESDIYKPFLNSLTATSANNCVTPGDPDGAGPLISRIVQENDARQILSANAVTPGEAGRSIWFMSFGPWQSDAARRGGSSTTRINGVSPSGTTIRNGTYPTNRFLYMVTRPGFPVAGPSAVAPNGTVFDTNEHNKAKAAATDFVSWVCANSTAHTSVLNRDYGAEIADAVTSEGFYRNPDNSGGTDTCQTTTT